MNETPTACKDKWKKIRENFRKANNLRKTKSGQAAKNFKPIRYAKELSFLSPYIISESESLTNLPAIMSGDDDDQQSNITSPPSTPGSPALSVATTVSAKSATKKKKTEETLTATQSLFQSYIEKKYSLDRAREEEDPIVIFFKNLGQTVKQFPPDLRVRVKRQVFNIVNEANEAEEELVHRNYTVPSTFINSNFSQPQNVHAHPAAEKSLFTEIIQFRQHS
ncbi:Alcohol dehydrogenase transcription factor Myb/SANT-like [Popillia japonica]|uniref:Alcohol dehydrogenase transcription factor Myb/SANT-like n=1 Tax=Popillia japonica TaxID=7064 RepID=A0AAW1JJB9_POPJA